MRESLSRTQIAQRVPHGEAMSLLDEIIDWDDQQIRARVSGHQDLSHPLRSAHQLGSFILVEYAAQAAAVHASLAGTQLHEKPKAAYLGAVKNLQLYCSRLDRLEGQFTITAQCAMQQPGGAIYQFDVTNSAELFAEGRLLLMQ